MKLDRIMLNEAVTMTAKDVTMRRTPADDELLTDRFVAEFVAHSESLEGYDCTAADVFNSVRDLVLADADQG